MPHPSAPNFYPSAPSAYPGSPDLLYKTASDAGVGADSATVSIAWNITDTGSGAEQIAGSFGSGTVTSLNAYDTGTALDVVELARTRPSLYPLPGPPVPQVPVPQTRLLLADTRTGRIHFELPYTKLSWSQKINQAGSATATIPLEDVLDALSQQGADNPARVIWGFITGPNRYSLAVAYGNTVLWAGPLNPTDELPSDPSIDIGATEMPTLLSGRKLVRLEGTGGWGDASRDVSFSQTNQRSLIWQLVQFAISKGDGYELPIVCTSPPETSGVYNYTYLSYDQVDVLKALQNQAAGEDGPDFRFDPYLYNGPDAEYLAYDLRIGTPYLDYGSLWTFDDSTSQVTVSGDALGMSSLLFATGSGQDRDKVVAAAADPYFVELGFPAQETTDSSRNSSTDLDDLNAYAAAALAAQRSPTLTWSVKALRDGAPQAGQYRIGDRAAVDVREHRLIDPGLYSSRIVALAGDETPWITSTLSMTEDDDTTSTDEAASGQGGS